MQVTTIGLDLAKNILKFMASQMTARSHSIADYDVRSYENPLYVLICVLLELRYVVRAFTGRGSWFDWAAM
jgi:hypothetical protein